MQGRRDIPDHHVADEAGQDKDREVRHEGRRGHQPQSDKRRSPQEDGQENAQPRPPRLGGFLLHRCGLFSVRWRSRGAELGSRRRPGNLPVLDDGGSPDHFVLHVDVDRAVLPGSEVGEEVPQVGGVELA